MKKVIEPLEKAWKSNADKMEHMECGDDELHRLSDVNNWIIDAIEILNSET
jgi:hypothetical protein